MALDDEIGRLGRSLFPLDADAIAADYLTFLAERVPENIAQLLSNAGQPDISMPHQRVHVEDLVRPLSTKMFPTEKLFKMADLLGTISTRYRINARREVSYRFTTEREVEGENPYTVLYAGSLFLYCFLSAGGPPACGYSSVIRLMATVPLNLDLQCRLQVCRFLGTLAPIVLSVSNDEAAPLSELSLAIAILLGSITSDLSALAEQAMRKEQVEVEWSEENDILVEAEEVFALRQLVAEMYGPGGKVRRAADRFQVATGERGEGEGDGRAREEGG